MLTTLFGVAVAGTACAVPRQPWGPFGSISSLEGLVDAVESQVRAYAEARREVFRRGLEVGCSVFFDPSPEVRVLQGEVLVLPAPGRASAPPDGALTCLYEVRRQRDLDTVTVAAPSPFSRRTQGSPLRCGVILVHTRRWAGPELVVSAPYSLTAKALRREERGSTRSGLATLDFDPARRATGLDETDPNGGVPLD